MSILDTYAPLSAATLDIEHTRPEHVRAARAWTHARLTELGLSGPLAEDAELVVSELLTNVHRHAPGPAQITLLAEPGELTLTCADRGSSDLPQLAAVPDDAETGRGLLLVRALCTSVKARQRVSGPGKRVVARLAIGAAA